MNTIVGEAGLVMAIKGYDDYQVCTSSHTLLIYLSPSGSFNGGATRLFLSGKYDQVQIYSYRANITGSKDISSLFPGYDTQNVFLFVQIDLVDLLKGHLGHPPTPGWGADLPAEGDAPCRTW